MRILLFIFYSCFLIACSSSNNDSSSKRTISLTGVPEDYSTKLSTPTSLEEKQVLENLSDLKIIRGNQVQWLKSLSV